MYFGPLKSRPSKIHVAEGPAIDGHIDTGSFQPEVGEGQEDKWDGKLDRFGRPIVNVKTGEDIPLHIKIETLRAAINIFTLNCKHRKRLEDALARLCLELAGAKPDEEKE